MYKILHEKYMYNFVILSCKDLSVQPNILFVRSLQSFSQEKHAKLDHLINGNPHFKCLTVWILSDGVYRRVYVSFHLLSFTKT